MLHNTERHALPISDQCLRGDDPVPHSSAGEYWIARSSRATTRGVMLPTRGVAAATTACHPNPPLSSPHLCRHPNPPLSSPGLTGRPSNPCCTTPSATLSLYPTSAYAAMIQCLTPALVNTGSPGQAGRRQGE